MAEQEQRPQPATNVVHCEKRGGLWSVQTTATELPLTMRDVLTLYRHLKRQQRLDQRQFQLNSKQRAQKALTVPKGVTNVSTVK